LTTNSDDRKNLSWQTFRIGRGVKKTDTIDAKKRIIRAMVFGFLRGRVRFANASPSPSCGIKEYCKSHTSPQSRKGQRAAGPKGNAYILNPLTGVKFEQ
jgi:hypothetical protein